MPCPNLKHSLEELRSLERRFKEAYNKAIRGKKEEVASSFLLAQKLKEEIEEKLGKLKSELEPIFEKEISLEKQYQSQVEILTKAGILIDLENKEKGILGIDKKPYPIPTLDKIRERLEANKTTLEKKIKEGFQKLLLVPIGMSLDLMIDKYRNVILDHHTNNKLFATKKNPTDPDDPLDLDTTTPVWVWDKYKEADKKGELVYYPNTFDPKTHGGETKQELLSHLTLPGWEVILLENLPNIPRQTKGQTREGRRELEAGETPNAYLEKLKKEKPYQNETGLTPEAWLTYAITHLEEKNEVVDNFEGHGSINYNLGAYFPASGYVPDAYWYRTNRRAGMGRGDVSSSGEYCGVRSSVRV